MVAVSRYKLKKAVILAGNRVLHPQKRRDVRRNLPLNPFGGNELEKTQVLDW